MGDGGTSTTTADDAPATTAIAAIIGYRSWRGHRRGSLAPRRRVSFRPFLVAHTGDEAILTVCFQHVLTHHSFIPISFPPLPPLPSSLLMHVSIQKIAPLELVRTRQAAGSHPNRGVLEELRLLLRTSGPSGLYRGLVPMILRDVPFSALYFTILEAVRSRVSETTIFGSWGARYHRERGDRPPARVVVLEAFVGGMVAGSIATVSTTPFDVVKTRRMTSHGGRRYPGTGAVDATLMGHMRRIIEEEGMMRGLWRGNLARMIKVAPGSAIMISSYELGKRLLEDVM